jgi:triosephosphate isomerase
MCVGETLEQREQNKTFDIIENQIKKDLKGLEKEQVEKMIIAYEPIWAIGTGKTATSEDANDVIKFIREKVADMFGKDTADKVRIQYGGSVKSSTIKEQMAMSDIDGALVGGASLKVEEFAAIVNF